MNIDEVIKAQKAKALFLKEQKIASMHLIKGEINSKESKKRISVSIIKTVKEIKKIYSDRKYKKNKKIKTVKIVRKSKHKKRKITTIKNISRREARIILKHICCCNRCGSEHNLEVHHIDRNALNNSIENIEKLCLKCHLEEHKNENVAKIMFKRLLKK